MTTKTSQKSFETPSCIKLSLDVLTATSQPFKTTRVKAFILLLGFICVTLPPTSALAQKGQTPPGGSSNQNTNQSNNSPSQNAQGSQASGSLSVGPSILSYEAQDHLGQDIAYDVNALNSGFLTRGDIQDVSALADTIQVDRSDSMLLLQKKLTHKTRDAIRACHDNRLYEPLTAKLLVQDLNKLILGPPLSDELHPLPSVMAAITLATGKGLITTKNNRLILEALFPKLIRPCPYFTTPLKTVFVTTNYPNANNMLLLYATIAKELSDLSARFQNDDANYGGGPGTHGFLPTTASDTISAVTSLISLFTTATSMASTSVPANEAAVIPAIVQGLTDSGLHCEYIDLGLDTSYTANAESLFSKLSAVAILRSRAQTLINAHPAQILDPNNKPIDNPAYTALQQYQRDALTDLIATASAYDSFYSNIVLTNISGLLTADFYQLNVANNDSGVLLVVKSLYAGGDDRIKSNPFVNLFTDGPRISYVGGGAVSYFLIGKNGNVLLTKAVRDYAGFKKLQNAENYDVHNNLLDPELRR